MKISTFARLALATVLAGGALAASVAPVAATAGSMTITTNTTLTEDRFGPIAIGADGITLDCAGHRVSGPGFAGVFLPSRTGVTVTNCVVSGFQLGVRLSSGNANTLTNDVAENNGEGIRLEASIGNTIQRNVVLDNSGTGLQVVDSSGNKFLQNVARDNFEGIGGGHGSNIYIGNTASHNRNNGLHFGGSRDTVVGNVAEDNFNGFWFDSETGATIVENTSRANQQVGIGLATGSSGNTLLHDLVVGNGGTGIQVVDSSGNKVAQNIAQGNFEGIGGGHGSNVYTGNRASQNRNNGFHFGGRGDTITGNLAEGNFNGFWLDSEANGTLTGNTARGNVEHGIGLASNSSGTLVSRNAALNNGGIGFVALNSDGDRFIGNTSQSNAVGFASIASSNQYSQNTASQNRFDGFTLSGTIGSTLDANVAAENSGVGFHVLLGSTGNLLIDNAGHDNGLDAEDDNPVGSNQWTDNLFETCGVPPGC